MNFPNFLLAIPCLLFSLSTQANTCEHLVFENAWVREPPPVANVAAAYFEVANRSDSDVSLSGFSSPCCEELMMHATITIDGRSRMSHIDSLNLEPGQTLEFALGAKHLMLIGLKEPLRENGSIEINVNCAGGGAATVEFPVIKHR